VLNGFDPQSWLAYVIAKLPDHPAKRIDKLRVLASASLLRRRTGRSVAYAACRPEMQVVNAPCRMVGDTRGHIGKPCLPVDIAQS